MEIVEKERERKYVFAYGTLRRDVGHRAHRILARGATFIGYAAIQGTLYDLGGYPGIRLEGKGSVKGEVFSLEPEIESRTLRDLDKYEGLNQNDCQYRRQKVEATLEDGRKVEAWTYVLLGPMDGERVIEGGDYLLAQRTGGGAGKRPV